MLDFFLLVHCCTSFTDILIINTFKPLKPTQFFYLFFMTKSCSFYFQAYGIYLFICLLRSNFYNYFKYTSMCRQNCYFILKRPTLKIYLSVRKLIKPAFPKLKLYNSKFKSVKINTLRPSPPILEPEFNGLFIKGF